MNKMIIKLREGYYVIGRTSREHLGGPYKKKEDAARRELQLGLPKRITRGKGNY